MSNNSDDVFVEDIRLIADDLSDFYDELEGKTVLVAGGKGFLGTYFVNVLNHVNETLSTPMKIVIMDNLITAKDKKNNLGSNVTFLKQFMKNPIIIDGRGFLDKEKFDAGTYFKIGYSE